MKWKTAGHRTQGGVLERALSEGSGEHKAAFGRPELYRTGETWCPHFQPAHEEEQ